MVTCNENHAGMLQGIFDYGHTLYQAKIFQTNGILGANFETELTRSRTCIILNNPDTQEGGYTYCL